MTGPGLGFDVKSAKKIMVQAKEKRGLLFVVAAPSGAGKTTLCKALLDRIKERGGKELSWSVSYTTRKRREGEVQGQDYHFVDNATFDRMVDDGEFAEWANVHGKQYGTSRAFIEQAARHGLDLLMEIDIQGARQLHDKYIDACFIFILPPSFKALEQRLKGRGTEPPAEVEKRLKHAKLEMLEWNWFDYIIVNDDFDEAVDRLFAVVTCMRMNNQATEPRNSQDPKLSKMCMEARRYSMRPVVKTILADS